MEVPILARHAAAVALALALVPGMAPGQGAAPAPRSLPALSFDAMVGVTYGPSRIGAASYNTTTSAGRLALALRLLPARAAAQSPGPGLPFITVDGAIGGIRTPARSGATFYRSRGFPLARVALGVRLGSRGSFRPVAVLDYFSMFSQGDPVTDCPVTPNGTCGAYFPDVSGVSAGLGVRRAMGSDITVGLTGGVGRYKMVTGIVAEKLTGFHAEAEVAIRFTKHAGVVLRVGHIETREYQGARMWYQPFTFGLRLQ